MRYEDFEKLCLEGLIKDRPSDSKNELREYVKEEESQSLIKHFYDLGVKRYQNGTLHDERIAFTYCINTAVENLSLMF